MRISLALAACLLAVLTVGLEAQDEAGRTPADTSTAADTVYITSIAGEFRPAKG